MPLILICLFCYIIYGSIEGARGVAWPSMASEFGVPLDRLGVLLMASMGGALFTSFFSGRLILRLGILESARYGLILMTCGLLGITLSPDWILLLTLAIFVGLGGGLMDSSVNMLFAKRFSAGAMSWLHAAFGFGTILGPLLIRFALKHDISWRIAYLVPCASALTTALFFAVMHRRFSIIQGNCADVSEEEKNSLLRDALRSPAVWFGIALFFIYAGVEITLGEWGYSILLHRGIDPITAAEWLSIYWGAFTFGRISMGVFPKFFTPALIRAVMFGILLSTTVFALSTVPGVWVITLGLTGLFIAPIFPALMFSTSSRVGPKHTPHAIGLQISATMVGSICLPGAAGFLSNWFSLNAIPFFVLASSFLILCFYETANSRRIQIQKLVKA